MASAVEFVIIQSSEKRPLIEVSVQNLYPLKLESTLEFSNFNDFSHQFVSVSFQWTSPKGKMGIRCQKLASRPGLAFSNAPYHVQV